MVATTTAYDAADSRRQLPNSFEVTTPARLFRPGPARGHRGGLRIGVCNLRAVLSAGRAQSQAPEILLAHLRA
jgi:hypothetical protein